jgi:hypothetical protein
VPASLELIAGSLIVLFVAMLPLGAVLLRGGERFLGRHVGLSLLERVLFAFYIAGGVLFVLASTPIPWFGIPLVVTMIVAGAMAYLLIAWREGGRGIRAALRQLNRPEIWVVGAATVGLLLFEIFPISSQPFPDAYDGSDIAIWMKLTLAQHTLPWSLAPYANAGVVYPQGSTVWMALPVMLWGWSIPVTVVLLPTLFLSLTVPAAYCWGSRLGSHSFGRSLPLGLLFAAWFALVASWPRLFVGGGYDFVLALPLLLLFLGGLADLPQLNRLGWRDLVAVGVGAGVLACLSLVAGEVLAVLLLAYLVLARLPDVRATLKGLSALLLVIVVQLAFVSRSLVGVAVWFSYPSHVLTQAGDPPYSSVLPNGPLDFALVQGQLDPFVPWKWKLSPFPALSLLLQILLAVGLILVTWGLLRRRGVSFLGIPRGLLLHLGALTATVFGATGLLLLTATENPIAASIRAVTQVNEFSFCLFILYSVIAVLPLIAAVQFLEGRWARSTMPNGDRGGPSRTSTVRRWPRRETTRTTDVYWAVSVAMLLVPLGVGAFVTTADAPGWIHEQFLDTGNVTTADAAALQWAGSNLPTCSGVFVVPGSAGLFLPLYGEQKLIYQMNPRPVNQSYFLAVEDLTGGVYDNGTKAELLQLNVTEVLATAATFASYAPIVVPPLEASPDFRALFSEGDASVLEFIPGVEATGCPP